MKTVESFCSLILFFNLINAQGVVKQVVSGEDCLKVQQAAIGDDVTVHYEGRLKSNGKRFDSSLVRGEPINFKLGEGIVIQGWDEGLPGTCPGQKIKLEIPSELGYGSSGAGDIIPPNADLIFEMELISLKSKTIKIDVIDPKTCSQDQKTRDNDIVRFNYAGYFEDGQKYDSTYDEGRDPINATIGEIGLKGWDEGLKGACPGETRMVFIPYELAYGEDGVTSEDGEVIVPAQANLVMQIEFLKLRNRVLNFLDRISSGGFSG